MAALDGSTTPWDDRSFAFLGEVVQKLVSIVVFPEDAFESVTVRVKTVNYMLQHQEDLVDMVMFPPVMPQEEDAEIVTTRKCMYLPAIYVPLLLNSRGYTIKQLWDILYPAIAQQQELEICKALVKWLQVVSTGTALGNLQHMGDPLAAVTIIAPPADETLLEHRQSMLYQALPGLTAPPQSLETALAHMASALINQTNDNRQAREQKIAAEQEPKLPSSRFTVTLPVLMEYLQIGNEADLPDLWHKFANCTKKQDSQVLRDALDAFARSAEAYSAATPIVTTRLTQDILAFNFVGQSADDLKGGLHPFIISEGNAEHRQTNLEVARLYGLLTAGDATCSLADLEALSAKEVKSVPVTYWELESSLGMFGNLIAVVLGTAHPLTAAFRQMWNLMKSSLREDLHAALEYRSYVKPTHILRSVQLNFYSWFTHRRARLTPPNPDFQAILHNILMQVYVLPSLPPSLYQLVYPKKGLFLSSASVPGTVSTGSSTSAYTPSASSGASSGSTVSGLTAASASQVTGGRGSRIVNLDPIAAITSLVPSTAKLKDLIGTSNPPKHDNGTDMCLSFLLRQGCWSNCKRANQHTSVLSANEQRRLQEYLQQRLPTLTAASGLGSQGTAPATSG
jgi:hypothetical protein